MSFLESVEKCIEEAWGKSCYDCVHVAILRPPTGKDKFGCIGCSAHDKLLLPDYLPQHPDGFIGPNGLRQQGRNVCKDFEARVNEPTWVRCKCGAEQEAESDLSTTQCKECGRVGAFEVIDDDIEE
jgi:hypothetical protein